MKIEICQLSDGEKKEQQIPDTLQNTNVWSVWECEPSSFDWYYSDKEIAYIFEGRVIVRTDIETVEIKAGDFVTFPKGLKCFWDVKETIRKVYKFV